MKLENVKCVCFRPSHAHYGHFNLLKRNGFERKQKIAIHVDLTSTVSPHGSFSEGPMSTWSSGINIPRIEIADFYNLADFSYKKSAIQQDRSV